jgi:hypothetical protein
MPLTINGSTKQVPDVYGSIKILNSGATAIPSFNGLLIVGSARQGIGYNNGNGSNVIKAFSSVADALAFYGESDLVNAMQEAKKGGAGVVYLLNPAPLTRGLATIKDSNATPKSLFDLQPKSFGAFGNDIRLDITNTGGIITIMITPVKDGHFILQDLDATGSKTIQLDGLKGLAVGDTIKAIDNASATASNHTIVDIDYANNKIVLDTAIQSKTQSQYARIFKLDIDNKKTKTFNTTDSGLLNNIMNWLSVTGYFDVTRPANYDGDITLIGAVSNHFGLLTGAAKGTSPIATETSNGDFVNCANALERLVEDFSLITGVRVRIINVISSSSLVHGSFLATAGSMRTNQKSVIVVSGCALEDILLQTTNANHPIQRAKGLNSDDFILAGMGYDDKPAYLSLAPQLAGMISANAVQKNLTKDSISASKVEYFFGEYNKETETSMYVNAGVLIVQTEKRGFTIALATNTYQKREAIWNTSDKKTYLIQQRQIVDYVFEGYREGMQVGVGTENFDEIVAVSVGLSILDRFLNEGIITDRKIVKAYRVGNAIITVPEITPLDATDFIGFELQVSING